MRSHDDPHWREDASFWTGLAFVGSFVWLATTLSEAEWTSLGVATEAGVVWHSFAQQFALYFFSVSILGWIAFSRVQLWAVLLVSVAGLLLLGWFALDYVFVLRKGADPHGFWHWHDLGTLYGLHFGVLMASYAAAHLRGAPRPFIVAMVVASFAVLFARAENTRAMYARWQRVRDLISH